MKLGVWIYLLMVISGVISYYVGWQYINSLPSDNFGNLPFIEARIGVFMVIGGLGLAFFGFIYAKDACETELINRHKQHGLNQKEGKENGRN